MNWLFDLPEWWDWETKIWVDSEGRAAGMYYHKDTCLIDNNEGECWSPTPSPTGNEIFHQGSPIAVDNNGELMVVQAGIIGGGANHAPLWMGAERAADYYQNAGQQLMVGRIYDDPNHGGYFLGAVLPETTVSQVDMIRRSGLSGDWRYRMTDNAGRALNRFDAIGPWLVTRPALPLHRMGRSVVKLAAIGHPVYVGGIGAPLDVHESGSSPGYDDLMPWHIENRGGHFDVVKLPTDEVVGSFPTMELAQDQLAALYANEPVTAAIDQSQEAAMAPDKEPVVAAVPPMAVPAATDAAPIADEQTAETVDLGARLEALEARLTDLEGMVTEIVTSSMQVDELMPVQDATALV